MDGDGWRWMEMHREGKVQKEGPMEDLPARSDLVKRPYGKKDLRRVVTFVNQ